MRKRRNLPPWIRVVLLLCRTPCLKDVDHEILIGMEVKVWMHVLKALRSFVACWEDCIAETGWSCGGSPDGICRIG